MKLTFWDKPNISCINCGFFGYREGGENAEGSYLDNVFFEVDRNRRNEFDVKRDYFYLSPEGYSWNVIGCLHHVWSLWGSNSPDEIEKAKGIITRKRRCKYYFTYRSSYSPEGQKEMVRDKNNHRMMLIVGLINALAVVIAALLTVLLKG